ncbi:MAG: uracil phosphoribosyltransferase [Microbacteriaceae bacterium]|jgi:uracil phosphoribosyltransferase|nr:uracil phosphoribosyltransferase [Microbacteriaceae bacterium]MCI1206877.1 uracil phosphoribosyltransferase [Microbacteriaceae bacterium]
MRVHVSEHPLVAHKITLLRDQDTPSAQFRQLANELVTLLAFEATEHLPLTSVAVTTPVAETTGPKLAGPTPLVVPILRAGLGLLDGMTALLPTAEVGFLGLVRDETTLKPSTYAERLPQDLTGRHCFVVDPMLATGGTLVAAIQYLTERGATQITCMCLIGAPEGVKAVEEAAAGLDVEVYLGALDPRLNEQGYIYPGLGDAGDRLYGVCD